MTVVFEPWHENLTHTKEQATRTLGSHVTDTVDVTPNAKAHHRWVQTGILVLTAQYAHACLWSISSETKSRAEKAVTMETRRMINYRSVRRVKTWLMVRTFPELN